jgi:hypothetical protein
MAVLRGRLAKENSANRRNSFKYDIHRESPFSKENPLLVSLLAGKRYGSGRRILSCGARIAFKPVVASVASKPRAAEESCLQAPLLSEGINFFRSDRFPLHQCSAHFAKPQWPSH